MNKIYIGILLIVLSILSGCSHSKVAAFTDQRWQGGKWQVLVNDNWYELKSIENTSVEVIIEKLQVLDYEWKRNLLTDFQSSIEGVGVEVNDSITVSLIDANEKFIEMELALTKEKRLQSILRADIYPVASKDTSERLSPSCNAWRVNSSEINGPKINIVNAKAYLNKIEGLVANAYAYANRTSFNYHEAFNCLRASLNADVLMSDFNNQTAKLLSQFGDGHLKVMVRNDDEGYLPLLVFHTKHGYIALDEDRDKLLDAKHPYIKSIDGKPISFWLETAAKFAPKGSKQLHGLSSVKNLRYLPKLRQEANTPKQDVVSIELTNEKRNSIVKQELSLIDDPIKYGGWPNKETSLLENNIGYLRIAKMSKDSEFIDEAMESFKNTQGLIIDVRGNGGGRRTILKALMPYFLDETEFYISNLAKYRITALDDKSTDEGYLTNRYLYPSTSSNFSSIEREKINKFTADFKPSWQVNNKDFSDWHVMVHRVQDNPKSYRYRKPVVILMDQMNFSATDIFLNAMKGREGITLIGQASGGGSGRSRTYFLPPILEEKVGGIIFMPTMISYKTNGDLIEGVGVQPDVFMAYSISDLTGESDSILEKSITMLAPSIEF